jgi:hypothetical protein
MTPEERHEWWIKEGEKRHSGDDEEIGIKSYGHFSKGAPRMSIKFIHEYIGKDLTKAESIGYDNGEPYKKVGEWYKEGGVLGAPSKYKGYFDLIEEDTSLPSNPRTPFMGKSLNAKTDAHRRK